MKRSDIDWSILRRPLILLVASLLVGGGLLGSAHYYQEAMRAEYEKEQRRFQSLSRRYLAVDEEERVINEYLPRFEQLRARGIVGEEPRLTWAETVRSVGGEQRLLGLRFELLPQEPFQPPFPVNAGDFKTYISRMRLDLGLLHEDDLLRFLDALAAATDSRFSVTRCALRPDAAGVQFDLARPNVQAECELAWFTLRKPDQR